MAKSFMLATTLLCFGAVSVSAQSTSSPPAGASNSNISASTHCRDSNGQPHLETASNPSSAGSASSSSPSSSPSAPAAGGAMGGSGPGNTTGSASSGSSMSTGTSAAATESLPELLRTAEYCKRPVEKAGILLVQDRS